MKYVTQLSVILLFTFLGELAHSLIPLPIPAAIYGLVFLLAALLLGIVKVEQIRETGNFLISTMGLLFVPPAVKLLESWGAIRGELVSICVIVVLSTILVFLVAGKTTQCLVKEDPK